MIPLIHTTYNKRRVILKFIKAKNQAEIFSVVYIRKLVFIDEQNVSVDEELDGLDFDCDHFLVQVENKYVATARVYYENTQATIGRVAVLKSFRNKGYAKYLMKEVISYLEKKKINKISIGAQIKAIGFYEKLGFEISGDIYLDANIKHYPMELTL